MLLSSQKLFEYLEILILSEFLWQKNILKFIKLSCISFVKAFNSFLNNVHLKGGYISIQTNGEIICMPIKLCRLLGFTGNRTFIIEKSPLTINTFLMTKLKSIIGNIMLSVLVMNAIL